MMKAYLNQFNMEGIMDEVLIEYIRKPDKVKKVKVGDVTYQKRIRGKRVGIMMGFGKEKVGYAIIATSDQNAVKEEPLKLPSGETKMIKRRVFSPVDYARIGKELATKRAMGEEPYGAIPMFAAKQIEHFKRRCRGAFDE
jgi:hypothetical protein